MARKKARVRIPRKLRGKVQPWAKTRQKIILETLDKVEDKQLAASLLDIGKTTVYQALKPGRKKSR